MLDAQIDMLVSEWEKSKDTNKHNIKSSDQKSKIWQGHEITTKDSKRLSQTLRQSKYLSDSEDGGIDTQQEDVDVDRIRKSLSDVLGGLSDKEGLTDDELKEKVKLLMIAITSSRINNYFYYFVYMYVSDV